MDLLQFAFKGVLFFVVFFLNNIFHAEIGSGYKKVLRVSVLGTLPKKYQIALSLLGTRNFAN